MCSGARRPPPPTPSLPIHGPSSARTRPPARDGAEGDAVLALALASADRRRSCAGAQASAASPHRVHKAPPRRALHEAPPPPDRPAAPSSAQGGATPDSPPPGRVAGSGRSAALSRLPCGGGKELARARGGGGPPRPRRPARVAVRPPCSPAASAPAHPKLREEEVEGGRRSASRTLPGGPPAGREGRGPLPRRMRAAVPRVRRRERERARARRPPWTRDTVEEERWRRVERGGGGARARHRVRWPCRRTPPPAPSRASAGPAVRRRGMVAARSPPSACSPCAARTLAGPRARSAGHAARRPSGGTRRGGGARRSTTLAMAPPLGEGPKGRRRRAQVGWPRSAPPRGPPPPGARPHCAPAAVPP